MTTKTSSTPTCAKERPSRKGSVVTTAGASVAPAAEDVAPRRPTAPTAVSTSPNQPSKSAIVLKLLRRGKGATIAEMAEPTGWQPHSTRAYLSGLRKKGLVIIREQRRSGETTYRTVDAASATADACLTLVAGGLSPASSNSTEANDTDADMASAGVRDEPDVDANAASTPGAA